MEKTYKGWEIAKMISEGELEDGTVINSMGSKFTVLYGCLTDGLNQNYSLDLESGNSFLTSEHRIFSIERKKYSFTEAFKAYEEGKEIESEFYKYRYKRICGKDMYFCEAKKEWARNPNFTLKEINGEWYIND